MIPGMLQNSSMDKMKKERFRALLEKLAEKAENAVLIVEGKKDKQALQALGIQADFFLLNNTKKGLYENAEFLSFFVSV